MREMLIIVKFQDGGESARLIGREWLPVNRVGRVNDDIGDSERKPTHSIFVPRH